jgi:hypothetical protein
MAGTTEALEYMPLDGRLGSAAMDGSSNASGVTPEGVREGDPTALRALVDRRGPAVIAFCTQVCGRDNAPVAAAEAFARFRAAVRDAPDLSAVDPETLLRGATRHAAASMARTPLGPPPHGVLRSRGTKTCEHVPTMLAARANGALGQADLERLARHLDRCERCNAMAEIFRRAEFSYQDPSVDTLGLDTSTILLEALESVPTEAIGVAPAPAADAPAAAEPLTGAFPTLPDLEDEEPIEPEPQAEAVELPVEHVDEPAEELDADALSAEPLPEDEPPVAETGEDDALDLGETMEWEVLPSLPGQEDTGDEPVVAAAPAILEGGTKKRRTAGPVRALLIALPVLVVAGFIVAALALSGVFGGDNGSTPQQSHRPAAGIQAPVLTPLPVKVAKPAASSATPGTASSATPSATGTTAQSNGTSTTSTSTP